MWVLHGRGDVWCYSVAYVVVYVDNDGCVVAVVCGGFIMVVVFGVGGCGVWWAWPGVLLWLSKHPVPPALGSPSTMLMFPQAWLSPPPRPAPHAPRRRPVRYPFNSLPIKFLATFHSRC